MTDEEQNEAEPAAATQPPVAQIRDEINELVLADLLGPCDGEEEEVDEVRVSDRYLLGMLAPLRQTVAQEEDEDLADAGPGSGEEGATEKTTAVAETMFPSSMGLTFTVTGEAETFAVKASWGRYARAESDHLETDKGNPKKVWRRQPMGGGLSLRLRAAAHAVSLTLPR